MSEPTLDQLLEACRPDRGDLDLPEMSPLAARLAEDESLRDRLAAKRREDALLCESLDDVPITPGLLERLEQAVLGESQIGERSQGRFESRSELLGDVFERATSARDCSADVVGRPVTVEFPVVRTSTNAAARSQAMRPRWFLNSWLAGGMALGLVGVMLGLWWNGWNHPQGPASGEELASAASDWVDAVSDRWQVESGERSAARPLAAGIRARLTGWQVQPTAYDPQSVVYALQRDSATALLFVVRTPAPFLRDREPMRRLPSTGGVLMGAWKSGEMLFVLVVRGDQPRFEDFFVPVPPRVAMRGVSCQPTMS